MSARDRRLAAEKYKGRESATERRSRLAREKAEKKAARQAPAQQSGAEFDPAAFYDQHRSTPQSRRNRRNHKRNIPSDAQSGGGEAFADHSSKSITKWTRGWFR